MNTQQFTFVSSCSRIVKSIALVGSLLVAMAYSQNPVPQIVGPVKPSAVVPGSGAFRLTVYGANFVPGAVVNWNYQPRVTTFVSARELQAQILATDVGKDTAGLISVTNPTPGGGNSSASWAQVEVHASISTFAFSKPLKYGFGGWLLLPADFNHDGILDLLGQSFYSLVLFDGRGNGAFQFSSIAGLAYFGGAGGAYGDFNNDGYLDVIFDQGLGNNQSRKLAVMLGNSQGKLTIGSHVADFKGAGQIIVGDFNGDGNLDFVSDFGFGFSTFLGNGDGTFRQLPNVVGLLAGTMVAGDFNGDGKLDLAVLNVNSSATSESLYLFPGNGDGTFQPPLTEPTFPDAGGCGFENSMELNDFNGDGKPDLAFCTDSQIGVILGNGDGTFQPPVFLDAGSGTQGQFTFTAADINSDGNVDILVSQYHDGNNPQFVVLLGNGDGTFQPMQTISLPTGVSAELGFKMADLNNNGLPDLMIPSAGPMWIFLQ